MKLPTVKVKADNSQGFIVINECDVNDSHDIYTGAHEKLEPKVKEEKRVPVKKSIQAKRYR